MLDDTILKNILIVRLDNLGDVIMTAPVFKIIKEQTGAKITLLTSSQAASIAPLLDAVDDIIVSDMPWLKNTSPFADRFSLFEKVVQKIKNKKFDSCFIFSVYSQSILPTALIPWLADIPVVAGYSRENPYQLLSHWVIDKEPFKIIRHQLERDLFFLRQLGFDTQKALLPELKNPKNNPDNLAFTKPLNAYLVLHPGVSEEKREYPTHFWEKLIDLLLSESKYDLVLTGDTKDAVKFDFLFQKSRKRIRNRMGKSDIYDLCRTINNAAGMISVNTGPAHIGMCYDTPIIVLYAETNPQHAPWSRFSKALYYSVPHNMQSRNFIIQHVHQYYYSEEYKKPPSAQEILSELEQVIKAKTEYFTSPSVFKK